MLGDNQFAGPDQQGGRNPSGGRREEPANGRDAAMFGGQANDSSTIDLWAYARLVRKHWVVIVGALLASMAIAAALSLLTTPLYTAEATVQIDRQSAQILPTEDMPVESYGPGEEFFETQYGLLRSRSLAERVVANLNLAGSDAALTALGVPPPEGGTAAERSARGRKAAASVLRANLDVRPVRGSRLVAIRYDHSNPLVAARIANGFAENFIQANLDRKYESSSYARQFLEERILQTKGRLEDAERQLVAYAGEQQIVSVSEPSAEGTAPPQSLVATNLGALNASLSQARADRVAAQERWRAAQNSPIMALPEVLASPTIQRLLDQRAQLNTQYQQKLATYRPDYPEMVQLRAQMDESEAQLQQMAQNIRTSIQTQYTTAANQERALQRQVSGLTGDVLDLRARSIQYNILQRELDTTRTLYEGLLQRYKEVSVTADITSNNIAIIDLATPPGRPSKPDMFMNLVLAAFFGLGLGLVAALILEMLDQSLTTPDDIEEKLGLSILGVIPLLEKGETVSDALGDIRSGISEAYYSLRTALQFSTPDGAPGSMLVSSARPAEGKSTTAYAIALNLARVGKRVLLVDGDLRNPSMHRVIGVDNERGMSNLLSGSTDLATVVQRTSETNLFFIPCGPLPPNPAELWGGDRLHRFLADARNNFDHVVFDGPPVLGFADAPMLAAAVQGVVFVLESGGTRRGQARGALRRIQMGQAHMLGAVLTKFSAKSASYGGYDYAYDYHYGAEPAEQVGNKGKRG
ncbi:MAG: GumC family protein [Brevundimonas sp.]